VVSEGDSSRTNPVYKLTPSSGGWTYTSLYDFDLLGDGGELYGSVVLDASGNVFGVAAGGPYPYPNDGVAFEIMP
jgi:hypothetical protein